MSIGTGYGHTYTDKEVSASSFDWAAQLRSGKKTFLHVGCGPKRQDQLKINVLFRGPDWQEIRLDIDEGVKPDVVASLTSLDGVPSGSMDAIWSSHNLEHLFAHEVPLALAEFHRVLKDGGTLLATMPDLEAAARWIVEGKAEDQIPGVIGPKITPMDCIFGWRMRVAKGEVYMAHKTGYTAATLASLIQGAGFPQVQVGKGRMMDLWAIAKKGGLIQDPSELRRAMA
jgi:predicted SAM-dependent methyltransferase